MPAEKKQTEPGPSFNTPDASRAYIAKLFETVLRRHDYRQYINERLAGDFACTLAQYFEDIKAREAELQLRLNAADQRIDELTAQQAESRMITLSGCEFSEHELLRTAVRMVTGTTRRGTLRWVAMKDAFCCGSGVAHAL